VDGALSFGHIPINLKALDCDFYAASFHKWGGGPAATGFFYSKPEHVSALPPLYGYFDPKTRKPATDSELMDKFGVFGTHPGSVFLSIGQMLDFLEPIGSDRIQARLHYLKRYWSEQVKDEKMLVLLASREPEMSCSLMSYDTIGVSRAGVAQVLWQQHKILLGGAQVSGEFGKPETWRGITICNTALFTPLTDLDRFVSTLKKVLRGSKA
jgi:selenocysteine lyase/cysteine desulfurase